MRPDDTSYYLFTQGLQKAPGTYHHPGSPMEVKCQTSWMGQNSSSEVHQNCPVQSQHHADPLLEREGEPEFSEEDTFLTPDLTAYPVTQVSTWFPPSTEALYKTQTHVYGFKARFII